MPAKPQPVVDPYVTLGLEPGASMAEVKRAYRRMAKAFHPDSAGEQAIPRFLAIQAAYEQIRTGRVTLGGGRAGRAAARPTAAASAASAGSPGEPWRADPARARAARERARSGPAGTRAGGGASTAGSAGTPGRGAGGRASTGTSGSGTGSGGTGGATGAASGGPRRRATRKATMGSTSYDEARDPADATWSGASWYGPSTGEYWIVNPREYADPRKHGPDYQQRARRPLNESLGEAIGDPEPVAEPAPDETATSTSGPSASFEPPPAAPRGRRARPAQRWEANATESGWAKAGDARPSPSATDTDADAAAPMRWLAAAADDPVRRLGLALVAWPPLGLATAALIGDATGCATFGAQCDGAEPMLPWLAQAVILGLLLLVPPVTRILASGSVAVLVGLIPVTALLVALGASGAPQAVPAMIVLLAVIWLVGVVLATAMRVRRLGPERPHSRTGAGT